MSIPKRGTENECSYCRWTPVKSNFQQNRYSLGIISLVCFVLENICINKFIFFS